MPTSDDVMQVAGEAAARVALPRRRRRYPSFSEVEEQCAEQYEELLELLHEDDVFRAVALSKYLRSLPKAHQFRQDVVRSCPSSSRQNSSSGATRWSESRDHFPASAPWLRSIDVEA